MERTTSEIAGIKAFDEQSIIALMKDLGQPAFRAKQLIQWIYAKGAHSYDEMTNLPAALRDELAARYPLFVPELEERLVSKDGSRKYLVRFADGTSVETVGIPSNHRLTVCVSTQAVRSARQASSASSAPLLQARYATRSASWQMISANAPRMWSPWDRVNRS